METVPMPASIQFDGLARDWTVDDLDRIESTEGERYELVDGVLVVTPASGLDHEIVSALVRARLGAALPPGVLVVGPANLTFDRRSLRIPDLIVADIATMRGRAHVRPEDVRLVIEVVSPSSVTTDRITKPAQYAAAGIGHYWRIETEPVSLTVYDRDGHVYRQTGSWASGETARIDRPYPVEIDVARLLPDA